MKVLTRKSHNRGFMHHRNELGAQVLRHQAQQNEAKGERKIIKHIQGK